MSLTNLKSTKIPGYQTMCINRAVTLLFRARYNVAFFLVMLTASAITQADIYFSSRTIGPSTNIYSVNTEGEIKKITDNTSWKDTEVTISNDGEIVFMSNRKKEVKIDLHKQSEDFNIFKIQAKSEGIKQISSSPDFEHSPAISPDGRWIAYLQKSGESRKLMLLKNGETTPRTLAIADNIFGVSWSPNNHDLSITSISGKSSNLFRYDIKTDEKILLLEISTTATTSESTENKIVSARYNSLLSYEDINEGRTIASAQWSPDGKKLAIIIASNTEQKRELHVLDLQAKTNKLISSNGVQVQQPVSWSSDSKTVLYSGLVGYKFYFDEKIHKKVYEGAMQIYLADLSGKIQQLTKGENLHNRPVFSPDGKQIAFLYAQSLGDRTLALHVMSLKGEGRRVYYDRVAGDSYLYWR